MNIIDIILIVPIAWFAYKGFKRGFVIELTSLVALVLGIYAALYFSGYAATFLIENIHLDAKYISVGSFIVTFIVVVFLVYWLGKILEKVINIVALGFVNKMAGGIFGLLKAAVFLSIVILLVNRFNDELISTDKKEGSMLYTPVEGIAPLLLNRLKQWDLDDSHLKQLQEDLDVA